MRTLSLILCGLLATGTVQADTDVNVEYEHDDNDIVLRTEQGSLPATGIEQLMLKGDIGEVYITASETDVINWKLEIVMGDSRDNSPSQKQHEMVATVEITAEQKDQQLRLAATWPKSADLVDEVNERWTVTVPARLAAKVDMDIGALSIEGLTGGVEADLGIGELIIDIPRGSVRADLGIGDLKITSATQELGEVDLDVDIGEVRLEGYPDAPQPGYDFPVGQDLHFDAGGADDIQANLNIGEVAVTITTDE